MIIRTPTRTKTKSFKGDQMDFKFPSGHSSDNETHEEVELNNHFLVNESLNSSGEHSDEEKDLISPLLSSSNNSNISSKHKTLNTDGYYSFANISDNTTSPSFFHDRNSSESNDDVISILHINGNSKPLGPDYPNTLAPKKNDNANNTSMTDGHNVYSSPKKGQSMRSIKTDNTSPNTIPTADNLSYDIISSESISRLNSAKLDSLRLPSSSSSSNFSSRGSLLRGSATVKRTPMNLYRKPTMRKVESVIFSSDSSEASDNNAANNRTTTAAKPPTTNGNTFKQNKPQTNRNKKLPQQPIRRMSSMRANPKSTLKRSKAVRCHGGLLQYFEMIGIQIKKFLKHIRALFIKKRSSNVYRSSKNFNTRRSSSFNSTSSPLHSSLLQDKHNKLRKNGPEKNKKKTSNQLKISHHIPNSSSFQALQPVLIEKVIPSRSLDPALNNVGATKLSDDKDVNSPTESTMSSPVIGNGATRGNNAHGLLNVNTSSTRTNSTLRRTNSSIRRAASILTASTPSTTTYYSAENGSPVRKSKLIKSNASTSLSSLVRQPSIVVKNKVIPLSMSQYPMNELNGSNEIDFKLENGFENKFGSPIMELNNVEAFDTIREEDEEEEKRNFSKGSGSDLGSSIFTQLEATGNEAETLHKSNSENEQKEVEKEESLGREDSYAKKQEMVRQLMKTYLSQIIQKRILMRLQMAKFQETNMMEVGYKQMIDELVTDYEETECNEQHHMLQSKSVSENESDTSSIISDDNNSMRFSQLNATTDVEQREELSEEEEEADEENDKVSPLSLKYASKDIMFGMNTLLSSNRDKVMNIPASTIKRSMTLPIGMKI